jgi:IS30 family transposase
MKNNEKKHKHLTLDDRIEIMECLYKQMSFKAIARRIAKDPTTVSKEIRPLPASYQDRRSCPQLLKAPFVCNGCEKQNHSNCKYHRRKYHAKTAQQEYETVLKESREGIPLTKEEFFRNEQILSTAVRNGQNIYHAIITHHLPVSKSTVYRHIEKGYYIHPLDRPSPRRQVQAPP